MQLIDHPPLNQKVTNVSDELFAVLGFETGHAEEKFPDRKTGMFL